MDPPAENEAENSNNEEALNNSEDVESKEAASTNSTQNSDGKGSGGYSADNSLSEEDQFSDDTKEKPTEAGVSVGGLRVSKADNLRGNNKEDSGSSDSLSSLENTKYHKSSRQRKRALGGLKNKRNDLTESENTFGDLLKSLLGQGFLPQLNGMLLSHPMDPRIDLSLVQHDPGTDIGAPKNVPAVDFQGLSEDTYLQLMDSVRPFFLVQGAPLPDPLLHKQNEEASSDPVSSEGFTSYFTTTNTGSSNDNATHSADSSDSNKQQLEKEQEQESPNDKSAQAKSKPTWEDGEGHLPGVAGKRVRILETVKSHAAARDGVKADDGVDDGMGPIDQGNRERARLIAEASDSTTSSSSKSDEQMQHSTPYRIVTDVSSSNRTDSGAGTSESAGNTGSASNQGSSGSGDGKGSSEEGKGSSEEGKGSSEDNEKRHGDEAGESHEAAFGNKSYGSLVGMMDSNNYEPPYGDELREKLIHKKRKRIEMRREYEAQQQFESSESSGYNSESLLRPGKYVQMDQILQVSNIPRLVIQALSPFLVVHVNAAYSRLTGFDAHKVVGKSVSSMLAVPESVSEGVELQARTTTEQERQTAQDLPGVQGEHPEAAAALKARTESQLKEISLFDTLERLIVSCGCGHIQFVNAITSNAHQMVGRNVTFSNGTRDTGTNHSDKTARSTSSSLSGNEEVKPQLIPCRTAIAPIVSIQTPVESNVQTDQEVDPKSKRRKHHHSGPSETTANKSTTLKEPPTQHRRHYQPHVITHYIIQLERLATDVEKQMMSVEDSISSNSTSVEARQDQQKAAVEASRESPGLPGVLGDDDVSESMASQQEGIIAIG